MKRIFWIYLTTLFITFSGCSKSEDDNIIQQTDVLVINGNTYETVKIGNQIWMAENLREKSGINVSFNILEITEEYKWSDYTKFKFQVCYYNNDENNIYQGYGAFYNYEAAIAACPEGWHLPSDEDWKKLEKTLGMSEEEANSTGFRGNQAIKLKSTFDWKSDSNGTNSVGFNALPAGSPTDDGFGRGGCTFWWSSTEYSGEAVYYRAIYQGDGILREVFNKVKLLSVRYVKNQ